MSDDELNRLVCEKVLGWELESVDYGYRTVFYKHDATKRIPDFCNSWEAFGMLWEALVNDGKPSINVDTETGDFRHEAYVYGKDKEYPWPGYDTDPRRALVLAALKAYGVEV